MFKILLFNKKFIFTVLAMILLSMSVFARGYDSDDFNFNRKNGFYGRKLPNIQLTSEQMSQIQSIENKYYTQIENLRKDIYNQIQIIRLEMSKEIPDISIIDRAIDNKTKSASELQKIRIQCFLEIDKVYKTN